MQSFKFTSGEIYSAGGFLGWAPQLTRNDPSPPLPIDDANVAEGLGVAAGVGSSLASFFPVDVLVRMNNGYGGGPPTVDMLNASTLGLSNGSWSLSATPLRQPYLDSGLDITVSGLGLADGSGKGDGMKLSWRHECNGQVGYPIWTWASPQPVVTIGFAFRANGFASSSFQTYNLVRMDTGGGDYLMCVFGDNTEGPTWSISVHAPSSLGAPISITNNTDYWITMRWDQSGTGKLKVYSLPNLVLIGESTFPLTTGQNNTQIRWSCEDFHGGNSPGSSWTYDDIAMRKADVYPLLPSPNYGAASGTGTASAVGDTAPAVISGTASAAGTGTATGVGASTAAATAASSGSGAASGQAGMTASASGTGTATGNGSARYAATASSSGVGTATAVGDTVSGTVSGDGSASGVATCSATGSATAASTATASGTGAAAATGISRAAATYTSSGIGTANGQAGFKASASGVGAAAAVGLGFATQGIASSAGVATVLGRSTSRKRFFIT